VSLSDRTIVKFEATKQSFQLNLYSQAHSTQKKTPCYYYVL